jgi:putative spermidine/putrescine transport system substrate-binding protein
MRRRTLMAAAGLAALVSGLGGARAEETLVVVGWGGVWQDAYRTAVFKPFMAETGIKIVEEEFGGEYSKLVSQIEAGKITWDLAPFESPQVIQGCDEGAFVKLDFEALGGRDSFIDYAVHDCGIGSDTWATVLAYDADKLAEAPKSWADFWDFDKWPGKRSAYKDARIMIPAALVADGVPIDQVNDVLANDEGAIDRAFKKLDELKPHVLWVESPAEGMQQLMAGDVDMALNFNARVSGAARDNNRNLVVAWEAGFFVGTDYWVQIAGGPNAEGAEKFLEFMVRPQVQANIVKYLSYGVPVKAAYDLMSEAERDALPTAPQRAQFVSVYSDAYWVEHQAALSERFNTWASN